jgi:hypothetical protein
MNNITIEPVHRACSNEQTDEQTGFQDVQVNKLEHAP